MRRWRKNGEVTVLCWRRNCHFIRFLNVMLDQCVVSAFRDQNWRDSGGIGARSEHVQARIFNINLRNNRNNIRRLVLSDGRQSSLSATDKVHEGMRWGSDYDSNRVISYQHFYRIEFNWKPIVKNADLLQKSLICQSEEDIQRIAITPGGGRSGSYQVRHLPYPSTITLKTLPCIPVSENRCNYFSSKVNNYYWRCTEPNMEKKRNTLQIQ